MSTADAHEVWCRLTADESCARRVDLLIGARSSGSSKDQVVDVGVEARTARVTEFPEGKPYRRATVLIDGTDPRVILSYLGAAPEGREGEEKGRRAHGS